MLLFSTLLFSLFITMALIPLFKSNAVWLNCVDIPNERKLHSCPMPKVGGLAMAIGALAPLLVFDFGQRLGMSLLAGCAIIVSFGFLDDSKDLRWHTKLLAQIIAALVVVFWGGIKLSFLGAVLSGHMLSDIPAIILTVFIIIGVTNAVNLADGLDGLAGGLMLVSFSCIGYIAYTNGNHMVTMMAVATGGAILGFLPYNTHPATVFMGDTGSQLLGFLVGTLSLTLTQSTHAVSPLLPLFLVGLPILDTFMVMTERTINGRLPFHPDTNHMHHKLLRMNFFHSEAVLILFVLQCGFVFTGFLLRFQSEWLLITIFAAYCVAVFGCFFFASRAVFCLHRPGTFDRLVKQKLKYHIKERQLVIKASQKLLEFGFPFIIIVTCALPGRMPRFISIAAAGFVAVIGLTHMVWPAHKSSLIRLTAYFFIPFVIYYSETSLMTGLPGEWRIGYNLCFGVLFFFAIMTLKTSRRKKHFKFSPFDYVLLFAAIIIPNLPYTGIHDVHIGLIAAKIIILIFVSEVLMAELEGRKNALNKSTLAALLILTVRAVM
jgi:UDP-GlcNAc:undecaprenyl-phosphate GlcNAc-1-phosphate transferase